MKHWSANVSALLSYLQWSLVLELRYQSMRKFAIFKAKLVTFGIDELFGEAESQQEDG